MPKYNIKWLISKFENGEDIDFLYFFNYPENFNTNLERTCFNQWYESPFNVNEVKYFTVGHWILAQRALLFKDKDSFERIINSVHLDDAITSSNHLKDFEKEL